MDPLSRENSEETDAVSVAESVGVSERSEVKPMIKLIPLRKELRVEDSIRRMSVNSTNDDDLSVTSARSSIPSSGTGSRRPSEAQHFVPRRSEILNNHYDNRTNSKTAQKSDLSPNGRALDNDSLYQLMTPPRTATNSPSPAGDGHAPLNLTEVARSRNSLTKKDRDPPGYMGDKGRHHVALAGVASIQGNKLGYGNSDSGSSTARSRTNSVNQGGANVGKPRFGV